ncbi:MAG: ATP-binding protein [Bacteroidetes bacterium]|nr:MAG: ATP-binding protein [Bacteroidota bacterium]
MKVLLFWSSGKDSAWALHRLRKARLPVGALLTVTTPDQRVPYHNVPVSYVRLQAIAANLPLWVVPLPFPCPDAIYESVIGTALLQARQQGFSHVAFGDLYLEDIRVYREKLVRKMGLEPLFPIWTGEKRASMRLARKLLRRGVRAVVTAVDSNRLPGFQVPVAYDYLWLRSLPEGIDPCGEQGEFHTFCYDGPMFHRPISLPEALHVPFRRLDSSCARGAVL